MVALSKILDTPTYLLNKERLKMGEIKELINSIEKLNQKIDKIQLQSNYSNNHEKEVLTAKELSNLLNISKPMIYEQCKQGRIPHFKVGREYRFSVRAIQKWMLETSEENQTRSKEIETNNEL